MPVKGRRWQDEYIVPDGIKAGTKKTVKLSVYLEGNYTGKPNTTVSLTVNILFIPFRRQD